MIKVYTLTVRSGVLLDACQANGKTQDCQESYQKCLGAGQVTTSDVHCVSEIEAMIQAGNEQNAIQAANAQCKYVISAKLLLNIADR